MKRKILFALFCILSVTCNAQGIYKTVMKYDKFDDVEWKKDVKTLITKTDSTFVVETKGQKPVVYYYVDTFPLAWHTGSKDSLVNLTQDVWGFEDEYLVLTGKDREELSNYICEQVKDLPDSLVSEEKIQMILGSKMIENYKKYPRITIRTISRYARYYEYEREFFWIKFDDGSRLIYNR